jgi:hypothetical protein
VLLENNPVVFDRVVFNDDYIIIASLAQEFRHSTWMLFEGVVRGDLIGQREML